MSIKLDIEVRGARLVRQGLEDLTKEIPLIGRGEIYKMLQWVRKNLAAEPEEYTDKYPWRSSKQRRFVIWAIRTGKIAFPRQRTHKYSHGWRIRRADNGWEITNVVDYAHFIAGSGDPDNETQAFIHRGRWANLSEYLRAVELGLEPAIAEHIEMVARKRGF